MSLFHDLNIYCLSSNVTTTRYTSCHLASCVITLLWCQDICSAADIYIGGLFVKNLLLDSLLPYVFSVFSLSISFW